MDTIKLLFDTSGFPARWYCGQWSSLHGWIHVSSDLAIFGACFAITLSLGYFIYRRKDIVFAKIFWLFCAFIFFCGLTHLIDATLFWNPWYRFSALAKVITATVSWATVFALIPLIPRALEMPGLEKLIEKLKMTNKELHEEITTRRAVEKELTTTKKRLAVEKELLNTKKRLEEKNEEMKQFFYMVSHSMKVPVVTISGFLEVLNESLESNNQAGITDSIQRIHKANQRTKTMIDDLIKLSRAGEVAATEARVNLNEVVQSVWIGLNPLKNGDELSLPSQKIYLNFDYERLRQIVENLITNAIKYQKPDTPLKLEVLFEERSDSFLIGFRDNGIGISSEYHEKIFELFRRLSNDQEGSGVGLTIVKAIVRQYSGSIAIDSKPESGTTFWISFDKKRLARNL